MADRIKFRPLPPEEAVSFFQKKGYAIGFDWRDVWKEEHAVAFTVAKAMRIDILEDIRGAVDKAIADGVPFAEFQKGLAPLLQAKGWWGRKTMTDPTTGEQVAAQLGSSRRLRTIYDVNMRMAHSAGRWDRIDRVKKRRPYLRYVTMHDERVRQSHAAWDGIVRPVDDEWWDTHYPPNGWRCRCTTQQLSERDMQRRGLKVTKRPPSKTRTVVDARTGRTYEVPEGIDFGFDYNVGKARLRAFTPPPRGSLPQTFPEGVARASLPEPRSRPASRVLPEDRSDTFYVDRFLGEFGAARGKPAIFTDRAGEDVVVSADLFRDTAGALKVFKDNRHRQVLLLADTIKDPDEIWWFWEERQSRPGEYILRRRHIARWSLPDGQQSAVSVFEWGSDGWAGVTTFAPREGRGKGAQDRYLARLRGGTLAYRRGAK